MRGLHGPCVATRLLVMALTLKQAAAKCTQADGCSGCTHSGFGNPVEGSKDCMWGGTECRLKNNTDHCQMEDRGGGSGGSLSSGESLPVPTLDTSHGDGCIPPELNFDDPEWPMCKGGACVLRDEPEAAYKSMNIAAQMDVFGIPVVVDNTVAASERMFHLKMQSSILAQMLDDNQDGVPDDQNVVDVFKGAHALSPPAPWTGAGPKVKGFWVYNDTDSFTQGKAFKETFVCGARVYGTTKETVRAFMKAGCMRLGGNDGSGSRYMGMLYEETHHAFAMVWRFIYQSQAEEQASAALALWGNCKHGIECWPADWGTLETCDDASAWNQKQCSGPRDSPVVDGNMATCAHGTVCSKDQKQCKVLPNKCDGAYHYMEMGVKPGSDEGTWYGWAVGTANLISGSSRQQFSADAGETTVWTKTQFDNHQHTKKMQAYFSPNKASDPKTMQTRPHGFYNSDKPIDTKSCYGCVDTCGGGGKAKAVAGHSCAAKTDGATTTSSAATTVSSGVATTNTGAATSSTTTTGAIAAAAMATTAASAPFLAMCHAIALL